VNWRTVRVDGTGVGNRAAQWIMIRAKGWQIENTVVDIGFNLARRESAGSATDRARQSAVFPRAFGAETGRRRLCAGHPRRL
jgi:hypothetical protein